MALKPDKQALPCCSGKQICCLRRSAFKMVCQDHCSFSSISFRPQPSQRPDLQGLSSYEHGVVPLPVLFTLEALTMPVTRYSKYSIHIGYWHLPTYIPMYVPTYAPSPCTQRMRTRHEVQAVRPRYIPHARHPPPPPQPQPAQGAAGGKENKKQEEGRQGMSTMRASEGF